MDEQNKAIWDLDEDQGTDMPKDGQPFKASVEMKLAEPIVLSNRDRDLFLDTLANPPKPNEALTKAMFEHKLKYLKAGEQFTLPRGTRFRHSLYGDKLSKRSHLVKATSLQALEGQLYVTWMGANSYECFAPVSELVRAFEEGFAK